jgi:hypothetical protein
LPCGGLAPLALIDNWEYHYLASLHPKNPLAETMELTIGNNVNNEKEF